MGCLDTIHIILNNNTNTIIQTREILYEFFSEGVTIKKKVGEE